MEIEHFPAGAPPWRVGRPCVPQLRHSDVNVTRGCGERQIRPGLLRSAGGLRDSFGGAFAPSLGKLFGVQKNDRNQTPPKGSQKLKNPAPGSPRHGL